VQSWGGRYADFADRSEVRGHKDFFTGSGLWHIGQKFHSLLNRDVNLKPKNVNLTRLQPFVVTNSSVTIFVERANSITVTGSDKARIQCINRSKLIFCGQTSDGTLNVSGRAVGIGAIGTGQVGD
jgi:hypothetical protein